MNRSVFFVLATAIIAFIFGMLAGPLVPLEEVKNNTDSESLQEAKAEYYTCPMHPHIHQQHDGDCPICGMSLVSKQVDDLPALDDDSQARPEIRVDSSVINNFGIKTTSVVRDNIYKNIRLYGYVNKVKKREDIDLKSPVSGTVIFINHRLSSTPPSSTYMFLLASKSLFSGASSMDCL